MKSLHITLNIVHSSCRPSNFIPSFTHSQQDFLLQSHAQTISIYDTSPYLNTQKTVQKLLNLNKNLQILTYYIAIQLIYFTLLEFFFLCAEISVKSVRCERYYQLYSCCMICLLLNRIWFFCEFTKYLSTKSTTNLVSPAPSPQLWCDIKDKNLKSLRQMLVRSWTQNQTKSIPKID